MDSTNPRQTVTFRARKRTLLRGEPEGSRSEGKDGETTAQKKPNLRDIQFQQEVVSRSGGIAAGNR
jgi:hypothetical protein